MAKVNKPVRVIRKSRGVPPRVVRKTFEEGAPAPAMGEVDASYVPAGMLAGATNNLYSGDYGNSPAGTYQPAANPYANRYLTQNGQTSVNPNYFTNPFAGRPSGAELTANPAQYGLTPEMLADWQARGQLTSGNTTETNPNWTTVGGSGPAFNPALQQPPTLQEPVGSGGGGTGGGTGNPYPYPGPGLQEPNPVANTGPGFTNPGSYGPNIMPGQGQGPNLALPPTYQLPGGYTDMENLLAAFGQARGPNGEILPVMLRQGQNPFQMAPGVMPGPWFNPWGSGNGGGGG